jgi:hypothetical protein
MSFSVSVIRGGTVGYSDEKGRFPEVRGGERLHYDWNTSVNNTVFRLKEICDQAVEVINNNGFPCLYRVRASALPYELDCPDDEIVYMVAWDNG